MRDELLMPVTDVQMAVAARPKRLYPLDYPVRYTASGVNICRYHNYSMCVRAQHGSCKFDHCCCHNCGAAGHRALDCPEGLGAVSRVHQPE